MCQTAINKHIHVYTTLDQRGTPSENETSHTLRFVGSLITLVKAGF